jgi:hypothetical protein
MRRSDDLSVSTSLSRATACVALIGALALAAPVLGSNGGSNSGSGSAPGADGPGAPAPPPQRGCRSPGKNLNPVKTGSVGAGGQIDIEGSGRVTLNGSFMTWGTVRGMSIRVTDQRGDGMLRVGAACVPLRPGRGGMRTATVRSPNGRVVVDGTGVQVDISGRGSLAIAVTGSGTGLLNGVGTFTVNNGNPQSWPLKPIDLALAPTN